MSKGIDNLTSKLEEKLSTIAETIKSNAKEDREQLSQSLKISTNCTSRNSMT